MKSKVLVLIPTNHDKSYCIGKFIKNLKNLEGYDHILFADDTFDNDEYKNTIEGLGFEVIKVEETINALKQGKQLDIRQCLSNTRNLLKREFIRRKEYTHAMWFDSDIIMPKDTIPQLLKWNKDLVSGIYWQTIKRKDANGKEILDYSPVCYKYQDKETYELGLDKFGATITNEELFPSRLIGLDPEDIQITAIGTGVFLASRKLMEDKWNFRYNPNTSATEDMWFSIDIKKLGYKIYADSHICCRHHSRPWAHHIKTSQNQLKGG